MLVIPFCCLFSRCTQQEEDDDSVSGEECDPFASDPEDKWEKDFKMDSPAQRWAVSLRREHAHAHSHTCALKTEQTSRMRDWETTLFAFPVLRLWPRSH